MKYELVLQWSAFSIEDYDTMISVENLLTEEPRGFRSTLMDKATDREIEHYLKLRPGSRVVAWAPVGILEAHIVIHPDHNPIMLFVSFIDGDWPPLEVKPAKDGTYELPVRFSANKTPAWLTLEKIGELPETLRR